MDYIIFLKKMIVGLVPQYTHFILKYPKVVLGILILITGFLCVFAQHIPTDNSLDAFTSKDDPDRIFQKHLNKQFGTDDIIVIAFSNENIFTPESLELIDRITHRTEDLKCVYKVTSLTNVNNIIGTEENFIVEPLIREIAEIEEGLDEIKKEALANPIYLGNLISGDAMTTAILVQLEDLPKDSQDKNILISRIKNILTEESSNNKTRFYVAGSSIVNYYSALYVENDLNLFLPLILVLIALVLYTIFRNIVYILIVLGNIFICLIWTLGFFGLVGASLNTVTTIVLPLITALAAALSVHVLTDYRRNCLQPGEKRKVLVDTMHHLFKPCLMACLTTAAGFASLQVSNVPPIKDFGGIAAGGMICCFLISFTFLPITLSCAKKPSTSMVRVAKPGLLDNILEFFAAFSMKHGLSIIIISVLLVLASIVGIFRLKIETNLLEFFKKKSDVYQSTKFVEKNLSGVTFADISLESELTDAFKDPTILRQIESLHDHLKTYDQVDKVTSINDYLKEMHKSFHNEDNAYYRLPESRELVAQYLLLFDSDDLEDFIDSDYRWARVSVRITEHSSEKLKELIDNIKSYAIKNLGKNLKVKMTGTAVLKSNLIDRILKSQIQSLGMAMIIIFTLIFLVFRSIKMGMISIAPNLLPIVINFGIMGWTGIPLNTATSMISAIAIGIVVDDTIHFLAFYNQNGDHIHSISRTIFAKGRAIITTSVVLFVGFGILLFSNFVPTIYFGILVASIMVIAILGDLILLPALLSYLKPKSVY